jgi:hypothetical protein
MLRLTSSTVVNTCMISTKASGMAAMTVVHDVSIPICRNTVAQAELYRFRTEISTSSENLAVMITCIARVSDPTAKCERMIL